MIQVAHITVFNPFTNEEEVIRVTSGSHFLANESCYIPAISTKLSYTQHLYSEGTTEGAASIGVGNLILNNIDGQFDYLRNYGFDGRAIEVYLPKDENDTVTDESNLYFRGSIKTADFSFSSLTIYLRNRMEEINVAFQSATFAGTNIGQGASGGYEGQATTIGGKIKPVVFGRCMCVEGMPLNDFFLVYGFNFNTDGTRKKLYKIYNVYVKGQDYLFCGDHASIELLVAATIPTGYYATCLAEGCIRLGSVPADNGTVVANVADAPDSLCSAGQVASRIFIDAGYEPGTDFNSAALAILDAKNSCPVGYNVTTNESIAKILNNVLSSIGAWMILDALQVFQFDIIDTIENMQAGINASEYASVKTFVSDIIDASGMQRIKTGDQGQNIPAFSVSLNHTKVWKTQDESELVDAVSQEMRKFFEEEFRADTYADDSVKTTHPLSPALNYDTYLNMPLKASLKNGDFSSDLTSHDAGWSFYNLNNGNGAISQGAGIVTLTPYLGQCGITQTLNSPGDISNGDWQLLVTIQAGHAGQVIVAQGGTGLFNESYAATTQDQNLIVPFTMSGVGTQSITVTLQTVDDTAAAAFGAVVICAPTLPSAPIFAALVNGDFTTPAQAGWTFDNGGGTGTATQAAEVVTLTPIGAVCSLEQTLVPDAIWPGNWLFGLKIGSGSSATVTIKQGATILYQRNYSNETAVIPFNFSVSGTQSLTINIATIDAVTVAKISKSFVCLNDAAITGTAVIKNQYFLVPFNTQNNGWTFFGSGNYTQFSGVAAVTPSSGTAGIYQNLSVPTQIVPGNWTLKLKNRNFVNSLTVLVYQGNVRLGTLGIGPSSTGTLNFIVSSFGSGTVTIYIQGTASIAFSDLTCKAVSKGLYPTYATVVNGNFTSSISNGWTFGQLAGGHGTVRFDGLCILEPSGTGGCYVEQTIVNGAGITDGDWILHTRLEDGYAGTVTIFAGTTQIFKRAYPVADLPTTIQIPFKLSSGNNLKFRLSTNDEITTAKFGIVTVYSSDTISGGTTFANIVNGDFENLIVNLQAGWVFANESGGTGTYNLTDGVFTLLPVAVGSQISQILRLPDGIFENTWNLVFTLKAGTETIVSIYQGNSLITAQLFTAPAIADLINQTLIFDVGSASTSGDTIKIVFATNDVATMSVTGIYIEAASDAPTPYDEAVRRQNFSCAYQDRFNVDVPIADGTEVKVGEVITLKINRFGLDDGLDFVVIGRDDFHDNEKIIFDVLRATKVLS